MNDIILYTLPNCGICHLIKKKLNAKNIHYQELNLEEYINQLNTDRAPVLQTSQNILYSPIEINNWINQH